MSLAVAPGKGRVHRFEGAVAFCPRPISELRAILGTSDDKTLFQKLAALVVSRGFDADPFVVVRTNDAPAVFVFGDITVDASGESIDGRTASTWIERPLPEEFTLQGGDLSQLDEFADCDLIVGTVGAAGFSFSQGADLPKTQSSVQTPGATEAETEQPSVETQDLADLPSTEVVPEPASTVQPVTSAEESAELAQLEEEDEDDFDPFAEPDLVDLEMIGSVPAPEIEVAAPELEAELDLADETILPATVEESDHDRSGSSSQPSGVRPPPTAIPPATTTGRSEPVGLRPAPTASAAPLSGKPNRAEPDVAVEQRVRSAGPATLRVDDGQQIEVGSGVYVGRYPSKKGLPEGIGEVVVQGEDISRVHWALVAEMSGAFAVEDLGSTSGTKTVGPDGIEQPLNPGARRIIGSGTKIIFGDRWALFER